MGKIVKPKAPKSPSLEDIRKQEQRKLEKEREDIETEIRGRTRRGALSQTIKTSETGVLNSVGDTSLSRKTLLGE